MGKHISFKNRHLTGKTVMKTAVAAMAAGVMLLALSSCRKAEDPEDAQTDVTGGSAETGGAGEGQEMLNDNIASLSDPDLAGLENLTGEYEYEGEYNSYDIDEPALEIKKNDDGTYQIQIDLFRLWSFYDDAGKVTEEGLEFTAAGPSGNGMNGVIKLEGDIAVVTIFGQEWLDFAGLSEYRFYKTSDVPKIDDFPTDQPESDMQEEENKDPEATSDELLDSFINGEIKAVDPADTTWAFSVADLNTDAEEWNSYSVGERVDLDNDGENELILNGPYGGIYLDARDGAVYEFAAAEGTALVLSYTYYNGAVWIMYSNRSSAGFEYYHMEKYEGADNLTAEMNFGEEFDPNNTEAGVKYTWNENEISRDEYTALCSRILAAEVNTN